MADIASSLAVRREQAAKQVAWQDDQSFTWRDAERGSFRKSARGSFRSRSRRAPTESSRGSIFGVLSGSMKKRHRSRSESDRFSLGSEKTNGGRSFDDKTSVAGTSRALRSQATVNNLMSMAPGMTGPASSHADIACP